ncbi:hypothetical protein CRE_27782 [Caenorhabditis remanei]|uniref:SPK domain-containing protein n=1 Tax=Caenorhabditis remanei TaxID=31234 RepID=E3MXR5_CAERE|nr:hypothetical protein CRE_27782 [Caenorhabditis remanei]
MDEETKIRMIFALSAPIDSGFLVKIKESDDVQTDHARRITEYKTKAGGFELREELIYFPSDISKQAVISTTNALVPTVPKSSGRRTVNKAYSPCIGAFDVSLRLSISLSVSRISPFNFLLPTYLNTCVCFLTSRFTSPNGD